MITVTEPIAMTLLSDVAIKQHLKWGSIVIDPFVPQRLNNASYDLSLGPWVARYRCGLTDEERYRVIRPHEDTTDLFVLIDTTLDGGFLLEPGERVLGHTREAAGGTVAFCDPQRKKAVAVNSAIHCTSTAQRIGISVCLDAGWGDVGYVYPWTLEITNHAPRPIWLPIGAIICQIAFEEVTVPERIYGQDQGSYITKEPWGPHMMLPKKLKTAREAHSPSER